MASQCQLTAPPPPPRPQDPPSRPWPGRYATGHTGRGYSEILFPSETGGCPVSGQRGPRARTGPPGDIRGNTERQIGSLVLEAQGEIKKFGVNYIILQTCTERWWDINHLNDVSLSLSPVPGSDVPRDVPGRAVQRPYSAHHRWDTANKIWKQFTREEGCQVNSSVPFLSSSISRCDRTFFSATFLQTAPGNISLNSIFIASL